MALHQCWYGILIIIYLVSDLYELSMPTLFYTAKFYQ